MNLLVEKPPYRAANVATPHFAPSQDKFHVTQNRIIVLNKFGFILKIVETYYHFWNSISRQSF